MPEKKMTNKEAAIRLILERLEILALSARDDDLKDLIENLLGHSTTTGRRQKISQEIDKQFARVMKIFASYLEGRQ
jgi:hypothetical protein